jgi:hypothetical protein
MRNILRVVMVPLVLAAGLIVSTPRPAEATVFGCEPGGTTFRYSLWETNITPCAEHLGDGHYRSYVSAFTYRWDNAPALRSTTSSWTRLSGTTATTASPSASHTTQPAMMGSLG